MKAYFTASIVGKRYHLANYQQIVQTLSRKHVEVLADHILSTTEEEIRLETKEKREQFHEQLNEWIQSSHCMIVEATFPSISVGYEISLALHYKKPVLVLYSEGEAPNLLNQHNEDHVVCERYTSASLENIIDGFLDYIGDHSDARFTFFITPELSKYLDRASQGKRVPKSVYLRQLLEADAHKHG